MPKAKTCHIPTEAVHKDFRKRAAANKSRALHKLWHLGGPHGWYYATWLWVVRGKMDQWMGGKGARYQRAHPDLLQKGDQLDYWTVDRADETKGILLLKAAIALTGKSWLHYWWEGNVLHQQLTFQPSSRWGSLYWWLAWPAHSYLFRGLIHRLTR